MHLNSGLTGFASNLLMLPQNYVANRIAPPVPVPAVDGFYREMNPIEGLSAAYDTTVAKGERPKMFDKNVTKKPFETGADALAFLLTDDEIASGDADAIDFMKDMIMQANVFAAKREVALANLILNTGSYSDASQIFAVAASNEWDDATSLPSIDIHKAKRIVKKISGYDPNTLLVPDLVYNALWSNNEVKQFWVGYAEGREYITEGNVPTLRLFGMNVVNAAAVNNSDSPLKGQTLGFLWEEVSPYFGAWAWVGYVDPMPSTKTGSFVSQFAFRAPNLAGDGTDPLFGMVRVKTFYDPWVEGEVYTVRTNVGLKGTNDKAGALITGVTTATS
jgi:hypothetical protein